MISKSNIRAPRYRYKGVTFKYLSLAQAARTRDKGVRTDIDLVDFFGNILQSY